MDEHDHATDEVDRENEELSKKKEGRTRRVLLDTDNLTLPDPDEDKHHGQGIYEAVETLKRAKEEKKREEAEKAAAEEEPAKVGKKASGTSNLDTVPEESSPKSHNKNKEGSDS